MANLSKRERRGILSELIRKGCPISYGSRGAPLAGYTAAMNKLCIFTGTMMFGYLGAMLAGAFGMETFSFGSFLLSGVGSILGVYVGWKVAQKLG